jgi:hypothetical protein
MIDKLRGVLRAMLLSKVKLAAAGLLMIVAFATTLARSGSGPERRARSTRSRYSIPSLATGAPSSADTRVAYV